MEKLNDLKIDTDLMQDHNVVIQARFFILGGLVLLIGTILLAFNDGQLDRAITDMVYDASAPLGDRFYLAEEQPWLWLYKNDKLIAIVFGAPILLMILIGTVKKELRYLRRYGWYGFFSIIIGVVVVINEIFKGFYGRPRPRQTNLWPNSLESEMLPFYHVWKPAFLDGLGGTSFPSGHVSIVVIFIVYFYLFMNTRFWQTVTGGESKGKKIFFNLLKWGGLTVSLVGGVLMGVARIVQGAHHASDVLWAFGMVYIVNAIIYYLFYKFPAWESQYLAKLKAVPESA